jgi:hypothetical protein
MGTVTDSRRRSIKVIRSRAEEEQVHREARFYIQNMDV